MARAFLKILLKSGIEFKRLELPKLTNHSPCNPSIIVRDDGLLCVYRGCNYFLRQHGYSKFYGSWTSPLTDSQNYIAEVSDDLECLRADLIEDRHSRARNDCLRRNPGPENIRVAGGGFRGRCRMQLPLLSGKENVLAKPYHGSGKTEQRQTGYRYGLQLRAANGKKLDAVGDGR